MTTQTKDKRYQELLQERADLYHEVDAIVEKPRSDRSTEDQERFDAVETRVKDIGADLADIEKVRDLERSLPPAAPMADTPDRFPGRVTGFVDGREGPYGSLGEQLQDIALAARGGHTAAPALERLHSVPQFGAAALGAGEAIDSDGGYLVQTDIQTAIMRKMHDVGQVLQRLTPTPLSANADGISLPGIDETSRVDGSRWGGIRGYWVDEGTAPTATKPKIHKVDLKLHKVAALGYATDELLREAGAMTRIFTDGFAEELRFKVEDAIIEGDGAGKPTGILAHAAAISITKETSQVANTVVHENLKKMWARFYSGSRSNGIWIINQDVEPALDDLAKTIGTSGVEPYYVDYGPSGVLRIKGRPVFAVEYCPTLGTVGDIMLVDFSQYAFIQRGPVEQAQSMHVRFTTDEMTFKATYRCDGELLWKSALTPFKGTNTQSPVITLATRA